MFGEFPCRYSHDRRFLPPNLSHFPAPAAPPAVHIDLPPAPILAEPIKPPKSAARMKLDMKRKKQRSKRRPAEALARNRGLYSHFGRRQSGHEDERAENFGFLRGEADELACQGVKPWEDDAWVGWISFLFLTSLTAFVGYIRRPFIEVLSAQITHIFNLNVSIRSPNWVLKVTTTKRPRIEPYC